VTTQHLASGRKSAATTYAVSAAARRTVTLRSRVCPRSHHASIGIA
jgi:hypothetical protein